MTEHFDIIVVGGGLIGSAFALNVASKTTLKIALVERSAPIADKADKPSVGNSNKRVIALGTSAVGLLTSLGVFQNLPEFQAHAYRSMTVWDEGSDGELHFNASDIGQSELGFMVDAIACTQALQEVAQNDVASNVTCYFQTEVESLQCDSDGGVLTCKDTTLTADLVIGADGARSWVRSQAKIFSNRRYYNQHAIVTKIRTANSHNNCAWQRFLNSGPVAALPVHDNYSSIVWTADNVLALELMGLSEGDFCTVLGQAFDWRLGEVVELGGRLSFPLVSEKAERYYAPSLALIGDAAHSIHPLAGQGANLGFKDVICLSDLLTSGKVSDIGNVTLLSKYEKRRRSDNEQTDWLMTALNSGYQSENPFLQSLRGSGMNWLDRRKLVKAWMIQQAMGV